MYTYSKSGKVATMEKTVTRQGDNFASVRIEVTTYNGKTACIQVFAFSYPFGEKPVSYSQFFKDAHSLEDAWRLFKGFQTLLGGEFND